MTEHVGTPVIAPCTGRVIVAIDGLPDMPVSKSTATTLREIMSSFRRAKADILLGHFRRGPVQVSDGQSLKTGDAIAQVGNSGNTSEPHLHINAQEPGTADAPFSAAPLRRNFE